MIAPVLWLLLANAVVVGGAVSCPEPAAVERELAALMPQQAATTRQPDRADLAQEGGALHVELRRGDGAWVAARSIGAAPSCDGLAVTTAVVIAAWEADLGPGAPANVDLGRPPPATVPARAAHRLLARRPAPDPARPPGGTIELGVALGGSLAGSSLAASFVADATVTPPEQPLAVRLALEANAGHRADFADAGGGAIEWRRFALAGGARYRAVGEHLFFDLDTSLAAGLLQVDLAGSPASPGTSQLDLGLGTGVRVGFGTPGRGRVLPWVGLGLTFWSREVQALSATSSSVTIPSVETALHIGLSGGP